MVSGLGLGFNMVRVLVLVKCRVRVIISAKCMVMHLSPINCHVVGTNIDRFCHVVQAVFKMCRKLISVKMSFLKGSCERYFSTFQ